MAVQSLQAAYLLRGFWQSNSASRLGILPKHDLSREDKPRPMKLDCKISKEAGYDPFGLANFFKKLMAQGGNVRIPLVPSCKQQAC